MKKSTTQPISDVYARFSEALADLIQHPECDPRIRARLIDATCEIESEAMRVAPEKVDAARIASLMPACFDVLHRKGSDIAASSL